MHIFSTSYPPVIHRLGFRPKKKSHMTQPGHVAICFSFLSLKGATMIVLPFSEDDNKLISLMTHPYFDDHRVRREHALQLRLKQLVPPLLDGGRAILWYCHLCQQPWYEVGRKA